jgi:type IV pilus assembly protein PilM
MQIPLPSIVFDLGASSIKLLKKSLKEPDSIEIIQHIPTPEHAIKNGVIQNFESIQEILQPYIQSLSLRKYFHRGVICLGGNSLIMKRILFSEQQIPNLADTILFDAEQYFQHDLDDLYFDYFIQPELHKENQVPVVLVGAKKSIVEQHVSLIRSIGLKIGIVDCSSFSISNLLSYMKLPMAGYCLAVHCGASSTQLILLEDGHYLYSRDIPIAGASITAKIAEMASLSNKEAEFLKKQSSFSTEDQRQLVENATKFICLQLFHEIKMTIEFYFENENKMEKRDMKRIYLSGGGGLVSGFAAWMSDFFSIPVSLVDPFSLLSLPKEMISSEEGKNGVQFPIAAGMAIRPCLYQIG